MFLGCHDWSLKIDIAIPPQGKTCDAVRNIFTRQSRFATGYAPHQKPRELWSIRHFGQNSVHFLVCVSGQFSALTTNVRNNLEFAPKTCIRWLHPVQLFRFRDLVDLTHRFPTKKITTNQQDALATKKYLFYCVKPWWVRPLYALKREPGTNVHFLRVSGPR